MGDDVMLLFFILLSGLSAVLFVMGYLAIAHHRMTNDAEKLKAGVAVVVAGLLILSMNLLWVLPASDYDSVRYIFR